MAEGSLYERLGGYDGIAAVATALLARLFHDPDLERFWRHRSVDALAREKQMLIEFLASAAGGPVYYMGRSLLVAHRGLHINSVDWGVFFAHLKATLEEMGVAPKEARDVLSFIEGTREDVVLQD